MLVHSAADLGLLIRDRRKTLGLDQRTLAERVGVSRQWLVAVEKGKASAEIGLVLRTLRELSIELDAETPSRSSRLPGERRGTPAIDLDALVDKAKGLRR